MLGRGLPKRPADVHTLSGYQNFRIGVLLQGRRKSFSVYEPGFQRFGLGAGKYCPGGGGMSDLAEIGMERAFSCRLSLGRSLRFMESLDATRCGPLVTSRALASTVMTTS